MRDRLIELLKQAEKQQSLNAVCGDIDSLIDSPKGAEFIADYLLANGGIVLPCKVGDRVWAIRKYKGVSHPQESVVSDMYFTRNMELMIVVKYVARGIWGKTVFRTKQEAERALKGAKK